MVRKTRGWLCLLLARLRRMARTARSGGMRGVLVLYDYLTRMKASGSVMAAFGTPGRPQMLAASPLRTGLSVPVPAGSRLLELEAATFAFRRRTLRTAGTGILGAASDSSTRTI